MLIFGACIGIIQSILSYLWLHDPSFGEQVMFSAAVGFLIGGIAVIVMMFLKRQQAGKDGKGEIL